MESLISKGISKSESWEGLAGKSTGSKGLMGASEALEGLQVERESFADKNEFRRARKRAGRSERAL
jgi:hypothetical protein